MVDSQLATVEDDHEQADTKQQLISIGEALKHALRDVWKDDSGDLFDMGYAINFSPQQESLLKISGEGHNKKSLISTRLLSNLESAKVFATASRSYSMLLSPPWMHLPSS